uniref:Secreted protein n=1 Tax=Setaria viridis TaxID=4556 RepID=A0A4U6T129_SETVI|nr:hypothetical protein SEVIR_9G289751v2 [Setaria viridis]
MLSKMFPLFLFFYRHHAVPHPPGACAIRSRWAAVTFIVPGPRSLTATRHRVVASPPLPGWRHRQPGPAH